MPKISALPQATQVNAADLLVIDQGNVTKNIPFSAITLPAAQSTFTQAGAGAGPRTLQSKERDIVSILDFFANAVSGAMVDPTGVVDSTLGIQAAINSGASWILVPRGTYKTTAQLILLNKNGVSLIGAGRGQTTIQYSGVQSGTAAVIKLQTSSYCSIENMTVNGQPGAVPGVATIAASLAAFGIYITSEGNNPITQFNRVVNCFASWCSVAGIQVGNAFADIDVNVDGNELTGNLVNYCGRGIGVYNTNTNNTRITGGAIASCPPSNVDIALGARGVEMDGILFTPDASYQVTQHIHIAKQISGPISFKNGTVEIFNEKFLTADPVSAGVFDYPLLTLENLNCTNNTTVPGTKIIDYQGSGSVTIRNCRFGGGVSTSGGAGGTLSFKPVNTPSSGNLWLITEAVSLFDGAKFDVTTGGASAFYKWLDIGTASGGSAAGDVPTNRPAMRMNGGADLEWMTLTQIAQATGVTQNFIGLATRSIWKLTIDKSTWTAAALIQEIQIATLPAHTRIVGAYCDTTIAYAGLAGTIQLTISGSGFDGSIIATHDVKSAPVTKGLLDADMGTGLTRAARIQDALLISWTGVSQPQVRLTSGTGNIGTGTVTNLSTGSTTIYLITETLP